MRARAAIAESARSTSFWDAVLERSSLPVVLQLSAAEVPVRWEHGDLSLTSMVESYPNINW